MYPVELYLKVRQHCLTDGNSERQTAKDFIGTSAKVLHNALSCQFRHFFCTNPTILKKTSNFHSFLACFFALTGPLACFWAHLSGKTGFFSAEIEIRQSTQNRKLTSIFCEPFVP